MTRQLNLPLHLSGSVSFDNFFASGNEEVLAAVQALSRQERPSPVLFLHGPAGSGKSHLLQALSRLPIDARGSRFMRLSARPGLAPNWWPNSTPILLSVWTTSTGSSGIRRGKKVCWNSTNVWVVVAVRWLPLPCSRPLDWASNSRTYPPGW
ncbi:MAG: hypothetical protein Ct9H300mP16_08600 [Pseudomonadota bacterium]|nr:MAG: hypothetical protein Ct9H300mP16_08600 [Pseudomonadota bacterium]